MRRQLLKSVNIIFFCADYVFMARCIACVSAVTLELLFGNDADYVQFQVVSAALTAISLLEVYVYMCFRPLILFSMISLNLSDKSELRSCHSGGQ